MTTKSNISSNWHLT